MRIKSKAQFEAWLDSNFWLEDVLINTLDPYPKIPSTNYRNLPKQVRLVCTLQVGGSYKAGKTRWMRDIEIIAHDVRNYSINTEGGFVSGNCCQGIELIEVKQGLGFTLDVPEILTIVCNSIEVLQYPDREELVESWFSSRDFYARFICHSLPTPEDWLNHFRQKGWEVVWRYYYSDEKALHQVPADYTGWFLQLRSRLNENPQGLFFSIGKLETGFFLHLRNFDSALQRLWVEAGKYIATFPEVTISCGNNEMNQIEWLAYLAQFDT